ncbi:MAG: hypothetical protein ACD_76C00106G0021 [uncultured bacterium]|nr:MAG: hypothetical protein ACD_76C00106G0021 [uncultured bacterium]HBD05577.1 murein biosynthesis integral membrane protein MurJ [Candidatus Uhrbacteria bacterium]
MIIKLLNSKSSTITGAAAVVGFFSLISRLVGLLRDRFIAGQFGAGDVLDIYFSAFKIPDAIFNLLIIGSLSASFIPLFTKYYSTKQSDAWILANNILNFILLPLIALCFIGILFANPLAELVAPGFDSQKQDGVALFMRIMFVSNFLMGISSVFGGILQSAKMFLLYSFAPIFYNAGIIIGALFFTEIFGPVGLAFGVVLGALLHLIVQIAGSYHLGYSYIPVLNAKSKEVRAILALTGPRVLGLAITHLNFFIMTIIASTLSSGNVTILQFAFNINALPIGVFAIAYAIAAFPTLSEHASNNDKNAFTASFSSSVRNMLFFLIPCTVLFLLLRIQIVRVVVGAGAFDWPETVATAEALAFFALSFFAQGLVYLLVRAFLSLNDTISPLVIGIASLVVNIFASLHLSKTLGVAGLAAGFTISSLVQFTLLWVVLRNKIGTLGEYGILRSAYIMTTAGIFQAIVTQLMKPASTAIFELDTFFAVFAQGLISGAAGLLAYFGISKLLKSRELSDFISVIKKRFFKKYKIAESAEEATGI